MKLWRGFCLLPEASSADCSATLGLLVIVTTAGSAAVFRFLEPEKAEAIALYLNNTVNRKLSEKGVGKDVQ